MRTNNKRTSERTAFAGAMVRTRTGSTRIGESPVLLRTSGFDRKGDRALHGERRRPRRGRSRPLQGCETGRLEQVGDASLTRRGRVRVIGREKVGGIPRPVGSVEGVIDVDDRYLVHCRDLARGSIEGILDGREASPALGAQQGSPGMSAYWVVRRMAVGWPPRSATTSARTASRFARKTVNLGLETRPDADVPRCVPVSIRARRGREGGDAMASSSAPVPPQRSSGLGDRLFGVSPESRLKTGTVARQGPLTARRARRTMRARTGRRSSGAAASA